MGAIDSKDKVPNFYSSFLESTKIPTQEEERELIRRYQENNDQQAFKKLVESHLKFVLYCAHRTKHYRNVSFDDLVQEGSIGLMRAAKNFDTSKNCKFVTYARYYIYNQIRDYIMNNVSISKMGKSLKFRKLFYNLRKAYRQIEEEGKNSYQSHYNVLEKVADKLGCSVDDTERAYSALVDSWLSLNIICNEFDENGGVDTFQDLLASDACATDALLEEKEKKEIFQLAFLRSLDVFKDREKFIFEKRCLSQPPWLGKDVGEKLGISRQRVQQIEVKLKEKFKEIYEDCSVAV